MAHRLGVSGSIIYSNPELFQELFWEDIEHIEIGEFAEEKDLEEFLKLRQEKQVGFGIHSPLLRGGSKYDLIERVHYDSEYAWSQLEREAEKMSALGARYILIHFPYFKTEVQSDTNESIEEGLRKLNFIQKRYSIELICEPKLGLNRSPAGINYLNNFPINIWEKYNIKLCIDIGDYMIAAEQDIFNYLIKWREFIKVVHLHNVLYEGNDYIWTPVHPTQEHSCKYKIEEIIRLLSKSKDVTFIFEHTPETNPSKTFVSEGYNWVRSLVDKEN
jgi:sugar phosphate isomerase/epimerase